MRTPLPAAKATADPALAYWTPAPRPAPLPQPAPSAIDVMYAYYSPDRTAA